MQDLAGHEPSEIRVPAALQALYEQRIPCHAATEFLHEDLSKKLFCTLLLVLVSQETGGCGLQ